MKERGKAIVVGWDFSENAELALDHALFYAYQTNMKLYLVHIIKRKSDAEKRTIDMQKIVDRVYQNRGKHIEMIVRCGSVSLGLKAVAKEVSAAIIFIGTHGVKGIQNYTGSNALKTIMDSPIPFVIVQAPRKNHTQFSLVCPIDFRKECKEMLYWVAYLAHILDAEISLVYPEYKTQSRVLRTLANLNFCKKYLNNHKVKYKEVKLNSNRFNDAIVDYAKKKHANLILTITSRRAKVQNYFLASKIQYLIANKEKISVFCVNPRKDLWSYGSYK
ncbi:MAG: nucleotide-binding universal stress UspA family protein [Ancylomarina sp.]|jgi:nucleotide-binding universal stress UspA family protein